MEMQAGAKAGLKTLLEHMDFAFAKSDKFWCTSYRVIVGNT